MLVSGVYILVGNSYGGGSEVFVAGLVLKCRRERKWAVGGASVPRVGKRLCPGRKVLRGEKL